MSRIRKDILDWAEAGHLAPENLRPALEAAGALPDAAGWRRFLDRLLLWTGSVMIAVAVVFFFAYNWAEMGRLAKIGLAQTPLLGALAVVWVRGLDSGVGKAALFTAALLVGALLALIGQTYQTGADPWELFAVWAAAIVPWALLGRLPVLWLLVIALANLALTLYFHTFGRLWGLVFAPERLLWLLFGVNTTALVVWEAASLSLAWLRERWSVRLLALASGGFATALAEFSILETRGVGVWGSLAWAAWMAAAWLVYRRWRLDVFVLAGGVLSAVIVVTTLVAKGLRFNDGGAGFLLLTLLVIGLSSAGAAWLRRLAQESEGDE